MPGAEFGADVRSHDSTGVIDLHGEINLGADRSEEHTSELQSR